MDVRMSVARGCCEDGSAYLTYFGKEPVLPESRTDRAVMVDRIVDGLVVWEFLEDEGLAQGATPVRVSNGNVFFVTAAERISSPTAVVFKLNSSTGKEITRWSISTITSINSSSLALTEDRVLVHGSSLIYAFDYNGEQVWFQNNGALTSIFDMEVSSDDAYFVMSNEVGTRQIRKRALTTGATLSTFAVLDSEGIGRVLERLVVDADNNYWIGANAGFGAPIGALFKYGSDDVQTKEIPFSSRVIEAMTVDAAGNVYVLGRETSFALEGKLGSWDEDGAQRWIVDVPIRSSSNEIAASDAEGRIYSSNGWFVTSSDGSGLSDFTSIARSVDVTPGVVNPFRS